MGEGADFAIRPVDARTGPRLACGSDAGSFTRCQKPPAALAAPLARDLRLQALEDVPYIPLGQHCVPMAYKKEITGVSDGYALFWNVKRS